MRLTRDAVGFAQLAEHTAMRTLWCSGVDTARLTVLAQCESLEALYIEEVKTRDLDPLAALRCLDILSVDGATKVESLGWLTRISSLSQLRLQHFPRVSTPEHVAAHRGLRTLDVPGSMWTSMKVHSFRPLSDLRRLRLLYLTNILALDGSLQPLAALTQLEELHIAAFYEWQEFATLAGLRPNLVCSWLRPFTELGHQTCDECRSNLVMLTGKRQAILCPKCDADRVRRHPDRFMRLKREAARQVNAAHTAAPRS